MSISNSSNTLSAEAKEVISVLRALTLAHKDLTSVNDLSRQYKEVVDGQPIPYKKFGFKSVEDFVTSSKQFTIKKTNGETYVVAKPSKDSAHITMMIARQKPEKKKKSSFRQPQTSGLSWNKSSYSQSVYPNLTRGQSRIRATGKTIKPQGGGGNLKKSRGSGDDNNNQNNQSNRNTVGHQSGRQSVATVSSRVATNRSNDVNIASKQQNNNQKRQSSQTIKQNKQSSLMSDVNDLREVLDSRKTSKPANNNLPLNLDRNSSVGINQSSSSNTNISGVQKRLKQAQNATNNTQKTSTIEHLIPSTSNQEKQINNSKTNSLSNRLQSFASKNVTSNNQSNKNLLSDLNTLLSSSLGEATHSSNQKMPFTNLQVNNSSTIAGRKPSVQDRLAIARSSSQHVPLNYQKTISNNSSTVINKEIDKTKKSNENMTYSSNAITALEQYSIVKRIPCPNYRVKEYLNRFRCQVEINGRIYSTYPADYATAEEAKLACAKTANEGIQNEEARKKYPMCTDSDPELALKIYQELSNHRNGIFCKNLPEIFESVFNESLPDHWLSIIETSDQFILEPGAGNNLIVFARTNDSESSAASTTSDSEFTVMDKIVLPWDQKHWNLCIHNCVSTVEIWARIVGENYSDKLDSLLNDIDVYMLTEKTRPTSISLGAIYLVCITECWYRVKVVDMDKSEGTCLCFYIDCGDEEWLSMGQLFICEPKFLKLAPQAIQFSLFGLEDFAENPNAKRHLDEMLIGIALVGEILSKRESFESALDSTEDLNPKIQVVLFDTSSKDDVNLNSLIIDKICDDTPPPELMKTGITNVNVTYISNNGEVFLQVKHKGLYYVQKLINQLVQSKFKEEQYKVNLSDMKRKSLFLIYDIDDKKWYRGALSEGEEKITDTKYNIFYVDHGMTKPTDISRIFRLESLSTALNKYSRQAIKTKLHNIPPINERIIKRMRGLLHENCPAIVKVAVNAVTPHVIIYKRFNSNEQNQALCNINDVIRIEHELESLSDVSADLLLDNKTDSGSNSDVATNFRSISLKSPITVPNFATKGELQKIAENDCVKGVDEKFDIFVPMISNPSNFIVQPLKDSLELLEMVNELQKYCMNNNDFIPEDMIEVGQAYAALAVDNTYYRVIVEKILNSMIHVYSCDYGNFSVLSNDKLKPLPARFRTLPKQAFSAKLYGVKPKHLDWDVLDCTRFHELTVGKKFVSIVKSIEKEDIQKPGLTILSLDLIDVSTEEDIYISELLIAEGRADPA